MSRSCGEAVALDHDCGYTVHDRGDPLDSPARNGVAQAQPMEPTDTAHTRFTMFMARQPRPR